MQIEALNETLREKGVIFYHLLSFDQATILLTEIDGDEFDPENVGKYEEPTYSFQRIDLADLQRTQSSFNSLQKSVKDFLVSKMLVSLKDDFSFIEIRHYKKKDKPVMPKISKLESFGNCVPQTPVAILLLQGACLIRLDCRKQKSINLSKGEMIVVENTTKFELAEIKTDVVMIVLKFPESV